MTIQLPVLIWTVINFCVLALVLSLLLFKPLLSFMDARRQKIDTARANREAAELRHTQAIDEARAAAAEASARRLEDAQEALESAKQQAERDTADKEREYEQMLEQASLEINQDKSAVQQELEADADRLVLAFVQKLVS